MDSCRNQVLKKIDKEKKKGKSKWSEGKFSPAAAPFFWEFLFVYSFRGAGLSGGLQRLVFQRMEVVPWT